MCNIRFQGGHTLFELLVAMMLSVIVFLIITSLSVQVFQQVGKINQDNTSLQDVMLLSHYLKQLSQHSSCRIQGEPVVHGVSSMNFSNNKVLLPLCVQGKWQSIYAYMGKTSISGHKTALYFKMNHLHSHAVIHLFDVTRLQFLYGIVTAGHLDFETASTVKEWRNIHWVLWQFMLGGQQWQQVIAV